MHLTVLGKRSTTTVPTKLLYIATFIFFPHPRMLTSLHTEAPCDDCPDIGESYLQCTSKNGPHYFPSPFIVVLHSFYEQCVTHRCVTYLKSFSSAIEYIHRV